MKKTSVIPRRSPKVNDVGIPKHLSLILILLFTLLSCSSSNNDSSTQGKNLDLSDCNGSCPNQHLTTGDVQQILKQAQAAANTRGVAATFSVTDRVGNVLAVYQMPGANPNTTIGSNTGAVGGLEGATVPSSLAAISKAGTGAYLSSQGNAFTTRTASQIIQEHFNPGERNQPGGPLFGVQFSQTICSDVTTLTGTAGPHGLPLGLSADPGGLPLYKAGDVVGGIGVELDGSYSLDRDLSDFDENLEEEIALVAASGFDTPEDRMADRIFVLGKSLRFSDKRRSALETIEQPLADLDNSSIISVPPFTDGSIRAGVTFGTVASGLQKTTKAGIPAATLVDSSGNQRFGLRNGTALAGGAELKTGEVNAILDSALTTAFRARAAIRRPLDASARVSIWVVDTEGIPLGFIRSEDAPVFGIDVALQKARTAVFFSSADAGEKLNQLRASERAAGVAFDDYVSQVRALLGENALRGAEAFADRSGGNLSRPLFPDGIDGTQNGPLSLPIPGTGSSPSGRSWSPFNTGLQLDLIISRLLAPLAGIIPDSCTDSSLLGSRLKNGIQIFPGSVPLYRGNKLIGGIGISGDGIDQDDLIAFYGASRTGLDFIGRTDVGDPILGFNAPQEIRADQLIINPPDVRLRYVNCPEAPFIASSEQNVCDGL